MSDERAMLQQAYIRVCRDSGFRLDLHRACVIAAEVVGKRPMDIWSAIPSLDVMWKIAAGKHPAALTQAEADKGISE